MLNDKKEVNGYPNPFAPAEEKKDPKYGLQYVKAFWGEHIKETSLFNQRVNRYKINRKYAEGLQSVDKYKTLLGVDGDLSYLNLDYTPPPVIPKFVDIICKLISRPYKIQCNPIDPLSRVEQDNQRNKLKANMFLSEINDQVKQMTGIPLIPEDEAIPETLEELELMMQLNYKPAEAIAIELALEQIRYNNDFRSIEDRIKRDLVVCKIAAVRDRYDENLNIINEYVDPVKLIIPYSERDDFKNIHHFGIIQEYTIQQLATLNPGFTEKDLFEIAKNVAGKNDNQAWNALGLGDQYYPALSEGGYRPYNHFKINVLDFEFLSVNTLNYVKTKKEGGNGFYFNKKRSDYELPDSSKYKKEQTKKNVIVKYSGYWVVGTDRIFNYGLAKNMQREKRNGRYSPKTKLSINIIAPNIYDMENKSLVERMIPFGDQVALIHLKMQQLLGNIAPAGVAVDASAIVGVIKGMGQGQISPTEIVKMRKQTGNLIFSSVRADGTIINGKPVETLDNGVGLNSAAITQLINYYEYNVKMIRDVTGVNESADASAPDPKALIGTTQIALQGTNNAVSGLADSFIWLNEQIAKDTILMIQDSIKYNYDAFVKSIGQPAADLIKQGSRIPLCEFGIKVEFLPDDKERMDLDEMLKLELSTGNIQSEDVFATRRIMKENVKLGEQFLVLKKKKYMEQRMAEAQGNSQAQSEQAQAAAQAKMEADLQVERLKVTLEVEKQRELLEIEKQKLELIHKHKMEEIALQNQGKVAVAKEASDGKVANTVVSAQVKPDKKDSKV